MEGDQGLFRLVAGRDLGKFGQLPAECLLVERLAATDHQRPVGIGRGRRDGLGDVDDQDGRRRGFDHRLDGRLPGA